MLTSKNSLCFIAAAIIFFSGCKRSEDKLFELLPSSKTNITFNNKLVEKDSFNVLSFEYLYNGAGVGVGDVNNDGLTDVFFAGNMVSSQLYLNKGGLSFEDVTEKASIKTNLWCTGVAMTDINQDGLLDIYLSTIQPIEGEPGMPNLLFLNKGNNSEGIPQFEEVAAKVGLADTSYSTQAAFLDYDLDGDLDMFLLNNAIEDFNRNQIVGQKSDGTGKSVDKLYRNDGMKDGLPQFTDVSKEAGILYEGWGLGVVVSDINKDGYPDIYAANDFLSNDLLYINNGDGTFTNKIASMLKHQEHNGMGMDISDINNDGNNDIIVMDMMPYENLRQKTMFSNIGFDRFGAIRKNNYQDQYMRNVLQINNGNGTFSDIGYMTGIYATDWSWGTLIVDMDNDGHRDIIISNGYKKDVTDQDFITYGTQVGQFASAKNRYESIMKEVEKIIDLKIPNFAFKNNGDLTFTDVSTAWGFEAPSLSNGIAYADFDNDGDLDFVTNNIDEEAFVFRNNSAKTNSKNHYLRIKLNGEKGNIESVGAKVWVFNDGKEQYAENAIQRGYKSSVENIIHFGLGEVSGGKVDSIRVTWQSGKSLSLQNVSVDTVISLNEKDGAIYNKINAASSNTLFARANDSLNIHFKHQEKDFVDFFEGQMLLPHKHSQSGPGIAVGDINGDQLEDFIIGASASKAAKVFIQQKNGSFIADSLPQKDSEDMGMLLFDADNDGDLDLYCVSGSSEFKSETDKYQDRFYRNTGGGKFDLESAALPSITSSGSCVVASDFDKDGDLDLFIGGRVVPQKYPYAPQSYILTNDGKGNFKDETDKFSSELGKVGMVSSALWTDVNNDGWVDLAVVGEWMPLTFFINEQGKTFKKTEIENTSGWWNSIAGGDFDNDGDIDYIAGNLGLNTIYKASESEPVSVCAKDFDDNGTMDAILCRYIKGKEHPVPPRDALTGQIPGLKNVINRYALYGKMEMNDLISKEKLKDALVLRSTEFASVYIENLGNNEFKVKQLPFEAQWSPLYGIVINDIDKDGNLDILTVGNSYAAEPLTGHHDAGIGNYLQGDGKGNFKSVPTTQSGFFVDGDAKGLVNLTLSNGANLYIATQNRGSLESFIDSSPSNDSVINIDPLVHSALLELKNGKKRKQEFYHGSGYLSGSSRKFVKGAEVVNLKFDRAR